MNRDMEWVRFENEITNNTKTVTFYSDFFGYVYYMIWYLETGFIKYQATTKDSISLVAEDVSLSRVIKKVAKHKKYNNIPDN